MKINKLSVLNLLRSIMCKDLAALILVSFSFSVTENAIYILEIFRKTFNFSPKGELQYFLSFSNIYLSVLLGLEFCYHGQNLKMLDSLSSNNYYTAYSSKYSYYLRQLQPEILAVIELHHMAITEKKTNQTPRDESKYLCVLLIY